MSAPKWWGDWRSTLTPHTGNLLATDLIECTMIVAGNPVNTVITGAQILGAVPTPSVAWGSITGTLSSQTDLNTALSGKASTGAVTGTGITMSTARILGRSTAGTGAIEEITIGSGLTLSAGTLTASGGSSSLTIGTTAIASGTVGRILFEGTGNVLQESANLFWDNTNSRLGIGTASPSSFLNVVSSSATIPSLLISGTNPYSGSPVRDYITINGTGNVGISLITNTGGYVAQRFYSGTTELGVFYCQESTKDFVFKNSSSGFIDFQTGGGSNSRLRIFNNGNVAIGTTTDGGYKLDINGTIRIQSKLSVGTPTAASAVMEVTSTTQGFLPPRMTTTQKNAIATPAAGLVVYDTTLNKLCVRTASAWETITSI